MRRHVLLGFALFSSLVAAATLAQTPPFGPELQVNAYTTGDQKFPAVAMDASGNFVVVWQSDGQDGELQGIVGRRYDTFGQPLGGEFQVNTYTTSYQYGPGVAMNSSGNFVVVWTSGGSHDGSLRGVFAQRFDSSGNPLGGELQVNTYSISNQRLPRVAIDSVGDFVVVWFSLGQDGSGDGVFGQLFDSSGNQVGSEFQVNTYTTGGQTFPNVAMNAAGSFVVAWESYGQDGGNSYAVVAKRYDSSGNPQGAEFLVNTSTGGNFLPAPALDSVGNFVIVWTRKLGLDLDAVGKRYDSSGIEQGPQFTVNTYTTGSQASRVVAMDDSGNFVVTWESPGQDDPSDPLFRGIFGQRFSGSGARVGSEFPVNTYSTGDQLLSAVALNASGNFVVTWDSDGGQDGSGRGVFAKRVEFHAAQPMAVDAHSATGTASNVNGVLETGETVQVEPAWQNTLTIPLTFTGNASNLTGPAGPTYTINDTSADYSTVAVGNTTDCFNATAGHDCYQVTVSGARPAAHWDAAFTESLSGFSNPFSKTWTLHVGESFPDAPTSNLFYKFIENLFHNGVTGGCGGGNYCPSASVRRDQMAVFLLKGKHGSSYTPPACTGAFADVPCPGPFTDWIEQLASEGITGGCGGGNYCPGNSVRRDQMAAFLLKAEHGSTYTPPVCTGIFPDVACPSLFADWIEQLATEGITGGCGGGNYCPLNPNTRGQMAVFLVKTFLLQLYGP